MAEKNTSKTSILIDGDAVQSLMASAAMKLFKDKLLVEKSFQNLMQDAVLRTKLQAAVVTIIEREVKP